MEINEAAFIDFPQLKTDRLRLGRLVWNDIPELFRHRSDPDIMKYIGRPLMQKESEARAVFDDVWAKYRNRNGILWAIRLPEAEKMIGSLGFFNLDRAHFRAEIGYILHADYWRQGIMREAVAAIIDYAFEVLGLHSIYARIDPENKPSSALLECFRFQQAACLRESFYHEGRFYDTVMYDLIRSEEGSP